MKKEDVCAFLNKDVKVTLCNGKKYRGKLVRESESSARMTIVPNNEYSFYSRHVVRIERGI